MQQLANIKTSVAITWIQRFHCVGTAVRFAARTSGTAIDNPQKCNYSLLSTLQNWPESGRLNKHKKNQINSVERGGP